MAAEFNDSYGDENVDIDVRVIEATKVGGGEQAVTLSVILTKVQSADDFVDAWTQDEREIEIFFRQVREAEVEYRRLTS